MWELIASFLLFAIGTTLKATEATHSLKLANEDIALLRKQIETIQNETTNLTNEASKPDTVNEFAAIKLPSDSSDILHNVIALIAIYQSQEIPTTPSRLANDLNIDQEIMLAHLWKYHNEQYMTFRNDGKRPDLNTAFFLCTKAWELIRIIKA